MSENIQVLAIDCQVDFTTPTGALFVKGADLDMTKASNFICKMSDKINLIHATLDSHYEIHIAHPIFWINSKGKHPNPYTPISADDVRNGMWTTTNPMWAKWGLHYVETLEKNGKYPLVIWPPHTIIGSIGHALNQEFSDACREWQRTNKDWMPVFFHEKGSSYFTEHYSVFRADVPVAGEPSTQLNVDILAPLREADKIYVMGEALSHCVKFSILDLLSEIGHDYAKKFVFLEDTSSSVPTFEAQGEQFISDMKKLGMNFARTTDF